MTAIRPVSGLFRTPFRGSAPGYSLIELMAFMAVVVTTAAFILPFTRTTLNAMSLTTDARSLSSSVSLAKMRAAAFFTKARIYVDLGSNTYRVERWRKTGPAAWVLEGRSENLAPSVNWGFSALTNPPPNTQAAIGQAPQCLDDADVAIANTACIVFNSRGIPIDALNAPFAGGEIYISDGTVVYGVTVSAGGLVRLWRSNVFGGAAWVLH